jgi:hypothetical protein
MTNFTRVSAHEQRFFTQQGYVRFPEIFTREEMDRLRKDAEAVFADVNRSPPFQFKTEAAVLKRFPQFRWIFAHEPLLEALRLILGDKFILIDEVALHDSGYGGWHTDTTSLEVAGHEFNWAPDFLVVQCAIYMQDNSEYAGGLDVIPGSHLRDDPYVEAFRNAAKSSSVDEESAPLAPSQAATPGIHVGSFKAAIKKIAKIALLGQAHRVKSWIAPPTATPPATTSEPQPITIPSRAGDLVSFNLRLIHQGTVWQREPVLPSQRKYALFFVCGANNRCTRQYREWLNERKNTAHFSTPTPPELIQFLRQQNIDYI